MRVASFVQYCAGNGRQLYTDFINSIPNVTLVKTVEECDVLIIWSVLWKGVMKHFRSHFDRAKILGKPVIIIEVGVLQRNITWKICVNSTDSTGKYWPVELWQKDRKEKLLGHIKPIKQGDKICICGQNAASENWPKNLTVEDWVERTVTILKDYTDRPIEIRPHPRHPLKLNPDLQKLIVGSNYTKLDDTDLVQRFKDYWAVINYNSYPGIQARLYNINAVVDITSLASAVSHCNLSMIEQPLDYPDNTWLDFMAHTEFTTEEIKNGLAYEMIQPLLHSQVVNTVINPLNQ